MLVPHLPSCYHIKFILREMQQRTYVQAVPIEDITPHDIYVNSRLFDYTYSPPPPPPYYYKRPVTRLTIRINVHILETGHDKSVIEASYTSRTLNFLRVSRTAEQINRSENEPLNFIDILIIRIPSASPRVHAWKG